MKHKNITSREQYSKVASRMEQLKDAQAGSNQAKELKLLTNLIINFEKTTNKDRYF